MSGVKIVRFLYCMCLMAPSVQLLSKCQFDGCLFNFSLCVHCTSFLIFSFLYKQFMTFKDYNIPVNYALNGLNNLKWQFHILNLKDSILGMMLVIMKPTILPYTYIVPLLSFYFTWSFLLFNMTINFIELYVRSHLSPAHVDFIH